MPWRRCRHAADSWTHARVIVDHDHDHDHDHEGSTTMVAPGEAVRPTN
jgi:hypothetical protein